MTIAQQIRITQREILALMRACDSGGVIQVTPGQARTYTYTAADVRRWLTMLGCDPLPAMPTRRKALIVSMPGLAGSGGTWRIVRWGPDAYTIADMWPELDALSARSEG